MMKGGYQRREILSSCAATVVCNAPLSNEMAIAREDLC
jgi:hypothetical protein